MRYLSLGDDRLIAARVLGGLLKGTAIYMFVWAIASTVSESDLYEYQQAKLHREKYKQLVEEERKRLKESREKNKKKQQ